MYCIYSRPEAPAWGRQSRCLGGTYELPGGQKFSIKLSPLSTGFPQWIPLNWIKKTSIYKLPRGAIYKPPRGPKDQKNSRFRSRLKISIENEIFERATHRGPIFCGEIETSRLKFSSEIKNFDRDRKISIGIKFFWSLGPLGTLRAAYKHPLFCYTSSFCTVKLYKLHAGWFIKRTPAEVVSRGLVIEVTLWKSYRTMGKVWN